MFLLLMAAADHELGEVAIASLVVGPACTRESRKLRSNRSANAGKRGRYLASTQKGPLGAPCGEVYLRIPSARINLR